jgi:hypothetical protein
MATVGQSKIKPLRTEHDCYGIFDEEGAEPAVTAQRLDGVRFEFRVASSAWLTRDRSAEDFMVKRGGEFFCEASERLASLKKVVAGRQSRFSGKKSLRVVFDESARAAVVVSIFPCRSLPNQTVQTTRLSGGRFSHAPTPLNLQLWLEEPRLRSPARV